MTDFSGLPLVIEAQDLLPRLGSPALIVVDLTSANRYGSGHVPGARFVDPSVPSWANRRRLGYCRRAPTWKSCSPNSAIVTMPSMWSTTTKAVAGPGVSSGCWMSSVMRSTTTSTVVFRPGRLISCRPRRPRAPPARSA